MDQGWNCRDYQEGDESQILALFKEAFSKEMSFAFWRWRFIENPFGQGIIKLLFDGSKLIGHYAMMPAEVQVHGTTFKTLFSMTTMTHPDYTGRGIFTYLAEEAYKTGKEKGYHFVYGFPNKNSQPGFVRKLAWQDLGKVTILEKNLEAKRKRPSKTEFVIKEIDQFDDSINSLWEKVKNDYTIVVPRTDRFLNWRFVRNPETTYTRYTVQDSYGNILGYVVLKTYAREEVAKGHIVDMLTIPEREVIKSLLGQAYDYFAGKGTGNISCWMPPKSLYGEVLEADGFIRSETETYFGFRSFSDDSVLNRTLSDIASWHITMGDSDVF